VPVEDLEPRLQVRVILIRPLEIEVIAGCRNLEAVISPVFGELGDLLEREVCAGR